MFFGIERFLEKSRETILFDHKSTFGNYIMTCELWWMDVYHLRVLCALPYNRISFTYLIRRWEASLNKYMHKYNVGRTCHSFPPCFSFHVRVSKDFVVCKIIPISVRIKSKGHEIHMGDVCLVYAAHI
jgi:hypothetical protein